MRYQFNLCALDTNRYQQAQSDHPVSIEPVVFDLLVYLIENWDRVVAREELLDNLWKGKAVSDAALGARLKDARKVVETMVVIRQSSRRCLSAVINLSPKFGRRQLIGSLYLKIVSVDGIR